MKILKKCILIMLIGSCSAEVYNWNVRALEDVAESDTDFGNDLKLQSELSNELQRDLLKISGKANEITDNTNLRKLYGDLNKDPMEEIQQEDKSKSFGMKEDFEANTKFSDGSDTQFVKIEQNGNEQNFNNNYQIYQGANDANDYHNSKYDSALLDNLYSKYNSDNHQASELDIKTSNAGHHDPQIPQYRYPNPIIEKTLTSYDDRRQIKYEHGNANNQNYEKVYLNESQKNNVQNQTINKKIQEDYHMSTRCPAKESTDIRNFLGTNLFKHTARKCFTGEDIILLTIRKDFENLMPKDLPQCLLTDSMIAVLMNYFYVCHRLISTLAVGETKMLVLTSFFDTLGGYLNFYLVPVAKYSYYAGQLSLETINNILRLHRQCKNYLNTNGNGWKAPMRDVLNELNDIVIEPLNFYRDQDNNEPSYCMNLDMDVDNTESEDYEKMIVSLPKLMVTDDGAGQLGNIWFPFRRKRVYNLKSQSSAYIVVKLYETVAKCYLYENVNQDFYNRKFYEWLLENINTHLSDDAFYPGLGAVLRVSEFLRREWIKARNYNNLWQTDYGTGESREKKSYQPNGKEKSKQYMVMPQNTKRNPKSWDKDESFFPDIEENQNSFKIDTNKLEKHKALHDTYSVDRKHSQDLSSDQLKLAAAAIEEQANANQTTQFRILEMTLIQWILVIIPLVVVIVIGIICCLKRYKKKKKLQVSLKEPGGGKRKGKKSEEETLLLNSNSKSVLHGKYSTSKSNRFKPPPHMRSVSSVGSTGSSSSSLMCQLPAKCFAFKRSGPAVIETTSLDYSSSDAEDKAIKKAHMKAVKIDEKTVKKKGKETSTASNNGVTENGKENKSKETPKK